MGDMGNTTAHTRHSAPARGRRHVALLLPNILTYGRILAAPVVAGALMWGTAAAHWLAFAVFLLAAVTDFFDGWLARAWQQQSALGRMLDPIADKLLMAAVLLVLSANGVISGAHLWAAFIILSREVLVSGLREFLGQLQVSLPVTWLAKWKTTIQLVAVGVLIVAPALHEVWPALRDIGLWGLWIAAGLTLYTGYDYLRAGLKHVMDEDG